MSVSGVGGSHGSFDVPEHPAAEAAASAQPAAASVTRGASNQVPLTAAHKAKIVADYKHLLAAGDITKHPMHMPLGIQFASIDVTDKIHSASFGHSATILVPEGPLVPNPRVKHDPNQAKEFYVQFGASTNTPAGFYGPFKIK